MKKIINNIKIDDIPDVIKFDSKDVQNISVSSYKVKDRLVYAVDLNFGDTGNYLGAYATDTRAKAVLKEVEDFVASKDKEYTVPKV